MIHWAQLLRSSPDVSCAFLDAADVMAGRLAEHDVLVMPGGREPLVRQLIGLEVDMLIAAALHPEVRRALEESGVGAIENIGFEPDQAVAAYLAGELF